MKPEDWKEIIYKNGRIDEEQVMKELEDYGLILREVPKVYCEITGGLMSKLNYKAEDILRTFEELFWDKEMIRCDVREILKQATTIEELKCILEEYLELNN